MMSAMRRHGFNQTELGEVLNFFNGKAIKPGGDGEYPAYGANGLIGRSPGYTHEDGIIVGRVGAYCGSIAYCSGRFWASDNTIVAKPKQAEDDIRYFSYLLHDLKLNGYAGGAAQPLVTHTVLKRVPALVAQRPLQMKIAATLCAYDDLIENNTRRIQIFERMAQALYREWFVHFRFPGHAKVGLVASPCGQIPQGWKAVRFDDLVESGLGGDWGVDEPDDDEKAPVLVIRGTDFDDIVSGAALRTPRRFITSSSQTKRQLRAGDLVVENSINAKSRCVGTTLLITDGILRRLGEPSIAASFCKVYRFKDPSLAPLAHLHMRHLYAEGRMAFYQNVAANGIGNFQSQRFLGSEYLVFPADMQTRQQMLNPVNDLTSSTLADQIFNLRRTRDLLLPKLVSGALDVSKLKIEITD